MDGLRLIFSDAKVNVEIYNYGPTDLSLWYFRYTANIALGSEWVFATVLRLKCYFSIATVFLVYWGVTPKPVSVSTRKIVLLWSPNVPNCAHRITPFKFTTWANRTHVASQSPILHNIHFSVASHEYVDLRRYIFFWGFPANVLCKFLGSRWMVHGVPFIQKIYQGRQCTCNVALRRVLASTATVEKQWLLHTVSVCS